MNSVAPASCSRFASDYYKTEEELMYACADAMHEEYDKVVKTQHGQCTVPF